MNPGDIILQRAKRDVSSLFISLHSMAMLQKPRLVHAGIYIGDGKMMTAELFAGVNLQAIDEAHDVAIPYAWENWHRAQAWLFEQAGKPYDVAAWGLCAVEPFANDYLNVEHFPCTGKRFMCSTIVGCAMRADNPSLPDALGCRCFTPNDLGSYLRV